MSSRQVSALREKLNKALRGDHHKSALSCYSELETLEPSEPRWPHRRGDLLRRMNRNADAVGAYAHAATLYAELGFLARAVAMAKVVLGIDPSRTDVLKRLDPGAASRLSIRRAPPVVPTAARKPPPLPATAAPAIAGALGKVATATLKPSSDADADEVRFDDAPVIEIELTDMEVVARTESEVEFYLEEGEDISAEQLAMLPTFPLFADLPQEALAELALASDLLELADGTPVVRTGEEADAMFAIVEGSVRVDVPGFSSGERVLLAEGDVFGEGCLLDDAARKADVTVQGRLVALRIPKLVIDDLVATHPHLGDVMFDLLTRRIVGNLLHTSALFAAFDPDTRRDVARLFEVRRADEKQTLIEAGKRSDGLYILIAGKIDYHGAEGAPSELGPVTVFGHDSLIARGAALYSVRTTSDVIVLRLPASSFGRLAAEYPPVLAHLSSLASEGGDQGVSQLR